MSSGSSGGSPPLRRKIVVLGFRGIGKTAVTTHFVEGRFTEKYDPTIEGNYEHRVKISNAVFDVQIIDTAGMDEYSSISRQASVGVDGYVLLYSIDSRSSLDKLELVHEKLLNLIGDNIPRVLVGNKSDLATMREVSLEEGQAAAGRFGVPFLECSAKEGFNIKEVFHTILRATAKDSGLILDKKPSRCAIL